MRDLFELVTDGLECFAAQRGILDKPVDTKVLDLVAEFPPRKISLELGMLVEKSHPGVGGVGAIGDGLVDGQDVAERQILGSHNENFVFGVDFADLANVRHALAA